jgi:hypothetical protein
MASPDIILKLHTLVMIQTKFGFNWSSSFKGEDFWKSLRRTTTMDTKYKRQPKFDFGINHIFFSGVMPSDLRNKLTFTLAGSRGIVSYILPFLLYFFSSPGPKRARWTIAFTWCPSSSYVVNFFKNLLLWNYWPIETNLGFLKFYEKRAITPRWVMGFTSKLQGK